MAAAVVADPINPIPVPQPAFQPVSLYVGDLHPDVTEAMLYEKFSTLGPVVSIRVLRDSITRRSLGYAYVNFSQTADAERALDVLNFEPIHNRPMRIMWSMRDPSVRRSGAGNIFIKNLHKEIDNKTLFDTFSSFGNILSCKVSMTPEGESKGYGFVHFQQPGDAEKAIESVNGKMIKDMVVTVQAYLSRTEREKGKTSSLFTNVYVKNLPADFTKEQLEALFTKFGKISSPYVATGEDGKSRGFGFVNFDNHAAASEAVEKMNESVELVEGKKLYVSRAMKKRERQQQLRNDFTQRQRERDRGGANLYVKHLDESVTDAVLRAEFSKFGNVVSTRVMRDRNAPAVNGVHPSRGFGFVCFNTAEEATKATTEANGTPMACVQVIMREGDNEESLKTEFSKYGTVVSVVVPKESTVAFVSFGAVPDAYKADKDPTRQTALVGTKPLYVSLAQRREERQVYLDQVRRQRMQRMQMMMPAYPFPPPGFFPPGMRPGPMGPFTGRPNNTMMGPGQPRMPPRGPMGGPGPRQQGQQQPRLGGPLRQNPQGVQQQQQQQQQPRGPRSQGGYAAAAATARPAAAPSAAPAVIDVASLASLPVAQQKQFIGERLYPLISSMPSFGSQAAKLTGMLLEMETSELLTMLEDSSVLNERVAEAFNVLSAHPSS